MKKLLAILAGVVLLGLIAWSVGRQIVSRGAGESVAQPLPVLLAPPRQGGIERVLSYAGTLTPYATVTLTAKVAGRVERITVVEGQRVERGDVVAQMEDDTVRLTSEQAAHAYRAAQAQYEQAVKGARDGVRQNAQALLEQSEQDLRTAEDTWTRLDRLYREGTISRSRWEEADRVLRAARTAVENARRDVQMLEQGASTEELDTARAQMQAMEAQAQLANLGLENARVTTPLAGRVAKVHTDPGNMASLATPLVTVVQDDRLVVEVALPEKHYADVRSRGEGIVARVRPTALEGQLIAGKITSISPTVDPSSRTFTVQVQIDNPDGQLRAGMYANVALVMESFSDALLVPSTALHTRDGRRGVFVVADGRTARFRPVELGLETARDAQVLGGLSPEDLVVVEGGAFLEDGSPVTPSGTAARADTDTP